MADACRVRHSQVTSLEKAQGQMPTLNEVVRQCQQVYKSRCLPRCMFGPSRVVRLPHQ